MQRKIMPNTNGITTTKQKNSIQHWFSNDEKGYLTTNITITSPKTKHPIPIYSHLFSAEETDFVSANVETYKGLNRVKRLFNNKRYTVVMDRGYDANDIITFLKHGQVPPFAS